MQPRLPTSQAIWNEVADLFDRHGLQPPLPKRGRQARRIVMISPHGFWADPPPAGLPDTGGQTVMVLELSRQWARRGREVMILCRRFDGAPGMELLEPGLWLVRLPAGDERFVPKERLYPLLPALSERAVAACAHFDANVVVGHYADGMAVAAEVGARFGLPVVAMPHSLSIAKARGMGLSPTNVDVQLDEGRQFWLRELCERTAMAGADVVVATAPDQLALLRDDYGLQGRVAMVSPRRLTAVF